VAAAQHGQALAQVLHRFRPHDVADEKQAHALLTF
jgi:hypothetical protein